MSRASIHNDIARCLTGITEYLTGVRGRRVDRMPFVDAIYPRGELTANHNLNKIPALTSGRVPKWTNGSDCKCDRNLRS
jgi:hypothetical protein